MPDARESFWSTLRREARPADCLALAAVPVVLVAVHLLPEETRMGFAFAYERPTVVTAYTAHFVHRTTAHLLANVLGYALLAGTGYALAVLAGVRRLFVVAAATYLLAFPPVLSALNLAVPRDAVGYGFSGLTMAFVGLLAVVLAAYAGRRLHPAVGVRHAPAGFFASLALVALLVPPGSGLTTALAAAAALGALGYVVSAGAAVRGETARVTLRHPGWTDLFWFGTLVFVGYPFVGFPNDLGAGATVVNAYVHLLGLSLAFIVAYLVAEAGVLDPAR